jgi:aspartate racemase
MNDKVIGILGGMGPEASAFYYTQLIKRTKVNKDQDHFHVIIEANPKIPDRTKSILGLGDSPLPELIKSIERLNLMKVDQAFITCMTSHYFYPELVKHANFELINALECLNTQLHKDGIKRVGLLATSGTIKTQLFNQYLKDIEVIVPSDTIQSNYVMDAIYHPETGIKSGHVDGYPISQLIHAGQSLIENGAEVLIGGCTEISMVLKKEMFSVALYDPMIVTIDYLIHK